MANVLRAFRRLVVGDRGIRSAEYSPFPDVAGRNLRMGDFEFPVMVRTLALPKGGRILEVGCGRGHGLRALNRLLSPRRLAGLDIDEAALAEADTMLRREGVPAELVLGDVRAMPFPDASFDLVMDCGTCYHIASPIHALAEIARVLRVGGLFVHETRLSQMMSHPVRSAGRALPLHLAPRLALERWGILWASRKKRAELTLARTDAENEGPNHPREESVESHPHAG